MSTFVPNIITPAPTTTTGGTNWALLPKTLEQQTLDVLLRIEAKLSDYKTVIEFMGELASGKHNKHRK